VDPPTHSLQSQLGHLTSAHDVTSLLASLYRSLLSRHTHARSHTHTHKLSSLFTVETRRRAGPTRLLSRHYTVAIAYIGSQIKLTRLICSTQLTVKYFSRSLGHATEMCFTVNGSPQVSHSGTLSVTSYFQTSSKDILFPVSLPPFSCPSCLQYLRPCALILLKTCSYISRLLINHL